MVSTGPLAGTKVIDLATDVPGAYACMLLGDMGAEVTRVEFADRLELPDRPEFRMWNRGKRSIVLDRNSPKSLEVAKRLATRSDALVTMSQAVPVELDYEPLHRLNERLVYGVITPYGDSGPLDEAPADDGTVSAFAGMYGDQGGWQEPPTYVRLPITSYATAFMVSLGVIGGIYAREFIGRGQRVEISMMSACLAMQTGSLVEGPQVRTWARDTKGQQGINPVYRLYKASDEWLFIACGNVVFWNKLCLALDRLDWLEDPRFEGAPWNIPVHNREALVEMLSGILQTRSREQWLIYLSGLDIPCSPVLSRREFAQSKQVIHNRILSETEDCILGEIRSMTVPINFLGTPASSDGLAAAPGTGQHTEDILSELGM